MATTALRNQAERSVQVNRLGLIDILKSNKEKHLREYEEAKAGYRDSVLQKIDEAFGDAKRRLDRCHEGQRQRINSMTDAELAKQSDYLTLIEAMNINMKVPRCYAKEYDAAIDMARWDVRDTLELSHAEFQCFVRDEWDWSDDIRETYSSYSKKMA